MCSVLGATEAIAATAIPSAGTAAATAAFADGRRSSITKVSASLLGQKQLAMTFFALPLLPFCLYHSVRPSIRSFFFLSFTAISFLVAFPLSEGTPRIKKLELEMALAKIKQENWSDIFLRRWSNVVDALIPIKRTVFNVTALYIFTLKRSTKGSGETFRTGERKHGRSGANGTLVVFPCQTRVKER